MAIDKKKKEAVKTVVKITDAEEKKKALEMDIASSLRDTDFERARSLSEKLEEIIKSL